LDLIKHTLLDLLEFSAHSVGGLWGTYFLNSIGVGMVGTPFDSDAVFSSKQVDNFVMSKSLQGDIYKHDQLLGLLTSNLFRTQFEDNWSYETDAMWVGRTVNLAIRETILHALIELAENAQLELMGKRKGQFPGLTHEQIDVIDKQSQFLCDYFKFRMKEKGGIL